jgi:ammonia channel protein AmtB
MNNKLFTILCYLGYCFKNFLILISGIFIGLLIVAPPTDLLSIILFVLLSIIPGYIGWFKMDFGVLKLILSADEENLDDYQEEDY